MVNMVAIITYMANRLQNYKLFIMYTKTHVTNIIKNVTLIDFQIIKTEQTSSAGELRSGMQSGQPGPQLLKG